VSFSNRPYSEALAIGNRQNEIMEKIMMLPDIEKMWDSQLVENAILESLL
jgi:kynurenine 3-monooxygenase